MDIRQACIAITTYCSIRIPAHDVFELRNGRHLGLIGAAAGTPHEQAAIRVAEFYLKDIRVAAQFLERCRAHFQALQQLIVTGPRPERDMIVGSISGLNTCSCLVLSAIQRDSVRVVLVCSSVRKSTSTSCASATVEGREVGSCGLLVAADGLWRCTGRSKRSETSNRKNASLEQAFHDSTVHVQHYARDVGGSG
jgi:hypothetical protein